MAFRRCKLNFISNPGASIWKKSKAAAIEGHIIPQFEFDRPSTPFTMSIMISHCIPLSRFVFQREEINLGVFVVGLAVSL